MGLIVKCNKKLCIYSILNKIFGPFLLLAAMLFAIQCRGASTQFNIVFSENSKTAHIIPGIDTTAPARVLKGKIYIRNIQLQGAVFVHELGVNESFILHNIMDNLANKTNYLSIADLHQIADNLTIAYRKHGLSFYQAFVVPQEIVNATVQIVVQPGKLSQITVNGNKNYSNQQILEPFRQLIGKRLYEPEIRQAMADLNRYPGLRVFGYFSMGLADGETRLNLKVMEEQFSSVGFAVDNYGLDETGKIRGSFYYSAINLLSRRDNVNIALLSTEQAGNIFGGISYQQPLNFTDSISLHFQRNDFAVKGDFEALGINGTVTKIATGYKHLEQTNNLESTTYNALISYKDSLTESDIFNDFLGHDTRFFTLEAGLNGTRMQKKNQTWIHYSITPIAGIISATNNEELNDNFYWLKSFAQYHSQWGVEIKSLDYYTIEVDAMYSDSRLPASERRSLTGPYSVRVLPPARFIGDNIFVLRASQYFSLPDFLPANWNFNPFVFVDYGYASTNARIASWMEVSGFGVGMILDYSDSINCQVSWGKPFQQNQSDPRIVDDQKDVIYAKFIFRL